jgi:hypothetical protein
MVTLQRRVEESQIVDQTSMITLEMLGITPAAKPLRHAMNGSSLGGNDGHEQTGGWSGC